MAYISTANHDCRYLFCLVTVNMLILQFVILEVVIMIIITITFTVIYAC